MFKSMKVSSRSHRIAILSVVCSLLFLFVWSQSCVPGSAAPRGQGPAALPSKEPTAKQALPAVTTSNPTLPQAHVLSAADLEAFLDGLMPVEIERADIAGAVVTVVKNGKVLFAKGYGYADVAKKMPVSPETTLFRPGSISKLFTWTAIMQLVEQGKLNLDTDVNNYLDFQIPPAFGKPITLRNIMTHTSGFEETAKDLFIGDSSDLKPLGEYLRAHMPQRIFPPGEIPAYSNYATAIAGYIVQRVSGQPFDDYIQEHIFKPLGMMHSTFTQPLPDSLEPLMSSGYIVASQPAKPFEVVQAFPAGSSSVTAADIARFMIAHLQNGQYEGVRILGTETAELMHTRQFAYNPAMNGMCLGFYEETRNGHRIIGHGGDTVYFHSDLHLMPDENMGFFVSYNSAGKSEESARVVLWHKILDRYFPYEPPPAGPVTDAKKDAQVVSGYYDSSRRSETNILKVTSMLGQFKVYAVADGKICISPLKDSNGELIRWQEIGPMMYRNVNGQDRAAFQRDASGRLVLSIDYPFFVFQRSDWLGSKAFNSFLIIASSIVFLLVLLLWPIGGLIRKHYRQTLSLNAQQRRLRFLVRIVAVLNLAFLLGWIGLAARINGAGAITEKLDPWIHLIQFVGLLGCVGVLVALYNSYRSWSDPPRWVWTKIFDTVIALACVAFVWFVFSWDLLHFTLNY